MKTMKKLLLLMLLATSLLSCTTDDTTNETRYMVNVVVENYVQSGNTGSSYPGYPLESLRLNGNIITNYRFVNDYEIEFPVKSSDRIEGMGSCGGASQTWFSLRLRKIVNQNDESTWQYLAEENVDAYCGFAKVLQ